MTFQVKRYPHIIFLSVLAGFLYYISPALVICMIVTAIFLFFFLRHTPPEDRRYLLSVIFIALALRMALLIAVQYYCFAQGRYDIFGDGQDNLFRGINLADYLKGFTRESSISFQDIVLNNYNVHGKTFFNGIFFALFGNDIISLKYLNLLSIAIAGWLVYDLASRLCSALSGRFALTVILFFPTIILWSITDLKDSHFILFVVTMLWGMDRLISAKGLKGRLVYLLLIIVSCAYAISLRMRSMLPILSLSFIVYFVYLSYRYYVGKTQYPAVRAVFFTGILFLLAFIFRGKIHTYVLNSYTYLLGINRGFLTSGGINYDLLSGNTDYYNYSFFFKYLFLSLFHFLMEPFLWSSSRSAGFLLFQPVVFCWYLILFFSIIGIIKMIKIGRLDRIFFPLVFTAVFLLSFGLSVSNIGTAIRIRDLVLPVLAMFASFAFIDATKERKRS